MTSTEYGIARHALYGSSGELKPYRNRYLVSPGTPDYATCEGMVEQGWLVNRGNLGEITGGSVLFMVTDAGKMCVSEGPPS
jgi:hypothetical protein